MPEILYTGLRRKCPICGENLWNEDKLQALYTPVQASKLRKEYYSKHVRDRHPDFDKWSKRIIVGYFATVFLVFALMIAARLVFDLSALIIVEVLFATVLTSASILVMVQKWAKRKSRQLWRYGRN